MDAGEGVRKRLRPDAAATNGDGGAGSKKPKQESGSVPSGVGSKLKPCTKFFSTSGCHYGDTCHFLHYVPGGYKAVSQMMNLPGITPPPPAARSMTGPPPFPDVAAPGPVKTRLCNKYNTAEGCKFGDRCHFAHGERELGKPSFQSLEDPRFMGAMHSRMGGRMDPSPRGPAAASSFDTVATAKVPIDASLAGAIIGKGGVNSKNITRVAGAKFGIRDHESDPNKKNIELEGTIEQIGLASNMVRDLIAKISSAHPPMKNQRGPPSAGNLKTKLCEHFTNGTCTFGDRCRFAHGVEQLRSDAA